MKVHAPFNKTQIKNLQDYQLNNLFHPFTCLYRGTHTGDGILVPTKDGMICEDCGYIQDWVHDFMTSVQFNTRDLFTSVSGSIRKSKIKKIIDKL